MAPVSPGATEDGEGGCWDMQGSITSPLLPPLPSRRCQRLCLGCLRVTTLLQVGVGSDPGVTDVTLGLQMWPGCSGCMATAPWRTGAQKVWVMWC